MNDGAKIGDYIRTKRTDLDMTITDVAKISGTSEATIKSIASNKTVNPGFWTVASIVDAVDGSLDELAGIKRQTDEEYEQKISVLNSALKNSEKNADRDYAHLQATIKSLERLLSDREKTVKFLRRMILIVSGIVLALIIMVFSVLMYDIRHPSIGYFQDDAGNIYPYATGDERDQDWNSDGDTITTGFKYYINK